MSEPTLPDSDEPSTSPSGGVWALPLLALGLGLIACGVIIPAADDNRTLMFEKARLQSELDGLERQVALNDEFLDRLHTDAALAERLAARQRTVIEPGVLPLVAPGQANASAGRFDMSPFALVAAEPTPDLLAPLPGPGGRLATWCREPRTRLGVLGAGLFACMVGLLGGGSGKRDGLAVTDAGS